MKSQKSHLNEDDSTIKGESRRGVTESKEPKSDNADQPSDKKKQKMIITGDDILIEYVSRIIRHLESTCNIFFKKYN